jgi:hypothetical protein
MEKFFGIVDALRSLAPQSLWAIENDDYDGLEWRDEDIKKPTKKAVEAEILRLTQQAEADRIAAEDLAAAKQAAKESALAKLAKLGLTPEEAAEIVGL